MLQAFNLSLFNLSMLVILRMNYDKLMEDILIWNLISSELDDLFFYHKNL